MKVLSVFIIIYFFCDYSVWFYKVLKKISDKIKKKELKLNNKQIEKYGLLVVLGKEVFDIFNVNTHNSRMAHEIDALIHLLFVSIVSMDGFITGNINDMIIANDIIIVLIVIYIRFAILVTHQVNVLFFDRYVNGVEKNNISSYPRIVIISLINMLEIYFAYMFIGDFNIYLRIVAVTTGMQFLASVVQLYNFNKG